MDKHGIEMMVVSLNAPAVQAVPDPARRRRRWRGGPTTRWPSEVAQASRPLPGAGGAADAGPGCARSRSSSAASSELGFKGALVNGFSQVGDPDNAVYYDLPQYRPFWAAVERLDVPFYLHPRSPLPRDARLYAGHPWLMGAAWAFGNETAVHALRLIGSGLFDEFPQLTIVLGHLGEGIPFGLWRIDHCNARRREDRRQPGQAEDRRLLPREFLCDDVGQFQHPGADPHHLQLGADRVMFSVDWPFEEIEHAAVWFDAADISENDRLKIGRDNAARLLKLV